MNKINLKFEVVKFEDIFEILSIFIEEKAPIADNLLEMLNIDKNNLKKLDKNARLLKIKKSAKEMYDKNMQNILSSLKNFDEIWQNHSKDVCSGFVKIFGNFPDQNCIAYSTFNNRVFPRYLDEKAFDFYFGFDEYRFLQTTIHEITHFIWFDRLKTLMPKIKTEEYESPSPVWEFSEIAVDMVFENCPYFKKIAKITKENPAYDHFYTDKIQTETIIEHYRKLYKTCQSVDEFIIKGTKEHINLSK